MRMKIGSLLGYLTFALARERRYITRINIDLCFPELDAKARAQLVRRCFAENGIGLIETATGWVRPPAHFSDLLSISGAHHMEAALSKGRGVLMLGAHYTTLDFSANLLSQHFPFAVTYRAHSNPLFDAFMLRGRLRNCNGVFDRKDIRGAFKHLRQGKILWYAPDQDYGPEQAVYAPFFGKPAATITAGSRFAAFNNSPVLLVRHHRLARKPVYVIEFIPVPEPFPGADDVADATLLNRMLEDAIRVEPAQYLWMHKRFKTQAGGKPQSPYINIRTPNKKLTEVQYHEVLGSRAALDEANAGTQKIVLQNGLQLWHFPGLASSLRKFSHPAITLDTLSKLLRSKGINTLTVDNIFRIASRRVTAVSCFVPTGEVIATATQQLAPEHAAGFFAQLHVAGYYCRSVDNGNLVVNDAGLAIVDPSLLHTLPATAGERQCCDDLMQLCACRHYNPQQVALCVKSYLANSAGNRRQALQRILGQLLAEQCVHTDNDCNHKDSPVSNDTSSSRTS
jgi:KDO2-lipid IV(A) lauroyltransferase